MEKKKEKVLIYFSFDEWGVIKSRKHHFAEKLVEESLFSKVIYVAPPISEERSHKKSEISFLKNNTFVILSPLLKRMKGDTLSDRYPLNSLDAFQISYKIEQLFNTETDIYIWCQSPFYAFLIEYFKHIKVFTDFTDDYRLLFPDFKSEIEEGMNIMAKTADRNFIVTENFRDILLKKKAKNITLLPNAVDRYFFNPRNAKNIPEDLIDLKKPIVGYVARITDRLDIDLIQYLLNKLPNVNFVFIGKSFINLKPLYTFSNFYFIGVKPYEKLPNYLQCFDACLLPHKINDLTKRMDPVKVYEYLAMHKPIVATRTDGIEKFKPYIKVADTYDEFHDGLIEIFSKKENKIQNIDLFLEKNTWHHRIHKIVKYI